MNRLDEERAFHDRQAVERSATFAESPDRLIFDDAAFLDHETWVRAAFDALGDLRGKDALDYGCGHGMAAVVMARAGANVTAFDLSPGYVAEARRRARANGVEVAFTTADAEALPFADASFDAVWGNAILHHLDLAIAAAELRRVLRPGGVAVFCEPWGENPLLAFARRSLPYPGKEHTPDERPLRRTDLRPLRRVFPDLTLRGHQLFGMVRRVTRSRRLLAALDGVDAFLLPRVPNLEFWCRYVVLTFRRR